MEDRPEIRRRPPAHRGLRPGGRSEVSERSKGLGTGSKDSERRAKIRQQMREGRKKSTERVRGDGCRYQPIFFFTGRVHCMFVGY
jgi:hypothetical protein